MTAFHDRASRHASCTITERGQQLDIKKLRMVMYTTTMMPKKRR